MAYGWKQMKVKHEDGREGVIVSESAWLSWLDLNIQCTDDTEAKVTLYAGGEDEGEAGWLWWCENFDGGAAWLPLGDKGGVAVRPRPG